jgi:hypothetical protein
MWNKRLITIRNISFSLILAGLGLLNSEEVFAQQIEFSGGATQKTLFGQHKATYKPSLGYEFGFNHQENDYRSAYTLNYGFNLGVYRLNRIASEEGLPDQHQQLFETKALFRYDYYFNTYFSVFSGAEAGFQFVNLKSDQNVLVSPERSTEVFTKAILAPQVGFNYEFNPYLAVYYKLSYDVGFYLGNQPDWGSPTSKWSHLLTNSLGIRLRIYN